MSSLTSSELVTKITDLLRLAIPFSDKLETRLAEILTDFTDSVATRDDGALVTLTSASNATAIDFNDGKNFTLTLGEDTAIGAPSNAQAGDTGFIYIIQDGTGGWTPTFNAAWKAVGVITADETASVVNVYQYIARASNAISIVNLGVEA